MESTRIRKAMTALAIAILSSAIGTAALAQDWRAPHPLASTDRYFDHHPGAAAQLERHPALVDNRRYVDTHPGLHEFLATHPVARNDWKSHPYRFMNREERYAERH
jgi:hypothetical protein